jgi:hypothetical protein
MTIYVENTEEIYKKLLKGHCAKLQAKASLKK